MRGKAATAIDDALLRELRAALAYDPETGEFRHSLDRDARRKAGMRADWLEKHSGYWSVCFKDSQGVAHVFRAHRLAWLFMTGEMPTEIDHIDRDRGNNRWANLREVTRSRNKFNCSLRSTNTSGKTGVSFDARYRKPWRAELSLDYQHTYCRQFATYEEAAAARRAAEAEHLGDRCPS